MAEVETSPSRLATAEQIDSATKIFGPVLAAICQRNYASGFIPSSSGSELDIIPLVAGFVSTISHIQTQEGDVMLGLTRANVGQIDNHNPPKVEDVAGETEESKQQRIQALIVSTIPVETILIPIKNERDMANLNAIARETQEPMLQSSLGQVSTSYFLNNTPLLSKWLKLLDKLRTTLPDELGIIPFPNSIRMLMTDPKWYEKTIQVPIIHLYESDFAPPPVKLELIGMTDLQPDTEQLVTHSLDPTEFCQQTQIKVAIVSRDAAAAIQNSVLDGSTNQRLLRVNNTNKLDLELIFPDDEESGYRKQVLFLHRIVRSLHEFAYAKLGRNKIFMVPAAADWKVIQATFSHTELPLSPMQSQLKAELLIALACITGQNGSRLTFSGENRTSLLAFSAAALRGLTEQQENSVPDQWTKDIYQWLVGEKLPQSRFPGKRIELMKVITTIRAYLNQGNYEFVQKLFNISAEDAQRLSQLSVIESLLTQNLNN